MSFLSLTILRPFYITSASIRLPLPKSKKGAELSPLTHFYINLTENSSEVTQEISKVPFLISPG